MGALSGIQGQLRTLFSDGALGRLSDAELLERFADREGEGAEAAFAALVGRHGPRVLGACLRVLGDPHEAEDAFQATFLVLARKAGAIGRREQLAGWLHGVALRTALKARAHSARRRRRERDAAPTIEATLAAEDRDELRGVLDEEIARLPEKYRDPVVLCHLEGVSRSEASRRLCCPENTLNVRLLRARGRLREGLTRRGFAPSAALLAAGLWPDSASAALPSGLAETTARAALRFATARAGLATGAVSAQRRSPGEGGLEGHELDQWEGDHGGCPRGGRPRDRRRGARTEGDHVPAGRGGGGATGPAARGAGGRAPWLKTLPGGETVELIGISTQPIGPKSWWGPDGIPLAEAPFEKIPGSVTESDDRKARVFAVRLTSPDGGKAGERALAEWKFPEASGMSSGTPQWEKRPPVEGLITATAALPRGGKTAALRLGVSSGAWKTEFKTSGGGITSTSTDKGQITFARARWTRTGVAIVVADTFEGLAIRIAGVNRDDNEILPSSSASTSSGAFRLNDQEYVMAQEHFKEFRFQTRKNEWVEFRDVPLEPRQAEAKP